jgi:hypothetical protein
MAPERRLNSALIAPQLIARLTAQYCVPHTTYQSRILLYHYLSYTTTFATVLKSNATTSLLSLLYLLVPHRILTTHTRISEPHTTALCIWLRAPAMCLHTTTYYYIYVSSCHYILLCMCPHTTIYYYICVLIPLNTRRTMYQARCTRASCRTS